ERKERNDLGTRKSVPIMRIIVNIDVASCKRHAITCGHRPRSRPKGTRALTPAPRHHVARRRRPDLLGLLLVRRRSPPSQAFGTTVGTTRGGRLRLPGAGDERRGRT